MINCPVCDWRNVEGQTCPNCNTDLSPFLNALELPDRYYREGLRSAGKGELDEAIEALGAALSADPGFAEARLALGEVYARKGWHREATSQFDKALLAGAEQGKVRQSKEEVERSLERSETERQERERKAARLRTLVRVVPAAAFLLGLGALPLFLSLHRSTPPAPPARPEPVLTTTPPAASGAEPAVYVVRPGDSLSLIAQRRYGNAALWVEVVKRNNLSSPDRLAVGDKILLFPITVTPR